MTVVELEHSDLAQHQASIFKRLHNLRKEGLLCDVVLKSHHGTEHQAHKAVLCAASENFQNMLAGPFREATQVQQAQPVEMAASDAVVLALLEYIYGNQPEVELEDSFELLRLADAYNLPELAAAIKASLRASLDSAPIPTALKVLQQTHNLHDLKTACEEKVAANFEICVELLAFHELSAGQLGRILRREDLQVSREEVVILALLNWLGLSSYDRRVHLPLLLQNVDFKSLSSKNLARLRHFSESMGSIGHDLQRDVDEALELHKKRSACETSVAFRPRRRCLQHWSPDLGAAQVPERVLPHTQATCCHDGAFYATIGRSILRWEPENLWFQAVAAEVNEANEANEEVTGVRFRDLEFPCRVCMSPEGQIFAADVQNRRLLRFRNRFGNVVLSEVDADSVSCSPNGSVYVLTQDGRAVEKLVGATLQLVISSEDLPTGLHFGATDLFVTKDEVIYLSDFDNSRILRINPGEEPVVVGEPLDEHSELYSIFVTEEGKIYVADEGQRKVWAFNPGDAAWTEVLECSRGLKPCDVLVEDGSLYVNMVDTDDSDSDYEIDSNASSFCHSSIEPEKSGIYQYLLPPEIRLNADLLHSSE